MWPYIFTTIAVAVFPLALAGYGGHLATLALEDKPIKKRNALFIVWSLAIGGIVLFALSQCVAYKTDTEKENTDKIFRTTVLGSLTQIIQEPERDKQRQYAEQLTNWMTDSDGNKKGVPKPKTPPVLKSPMQADVVPENTPLPSYGSNNSNGKYPEDFYSFLPYVWGFPSHNTSDFQRLMIDKYQLKHRAGPTLKTVKISYLQGDPSSYSMALFLERAYNAGWWPVKLIPRTDIGHVTGLYVMQDSIENRYEGVEELRTFANDNKIPWQFNEQPSVEAGTFEIWAGKGPEHAPNPKLLP
jgi:hypothetical protein